jgi:hypothetical protein
LRKANPQDSEWIPGEFYNEYRKAIRGRSASGLLETDLILETDLSEADLSGANLSNADLTNANLRYANLSGADLEGAQGVTKDQLEQQGPYLEGATMPDGQILKSEDNPDGPTFEEWLKSQGRKEDGENA